MVPARVPDYDNPTRRGVLIRFTHLTPSDSIYLPPVGGVWRRGSGRGRGEKIETRG